MRSSCRYSATRSLPTPNHNPCMRAEIARVADVLNGFSYRAAGQDPDPAPGVDHALVTSGIADFPSLLVLGLRHPRNEPGLD
jgi:hypothetical protein